jgi:3-hydroxyisobutyrate dehydrogenase-like beta-hydroxyacid dehydrogenase
MLAVINVSSGRNSATELKFPKYVLPRTFDSGSVVNIMHKDVGMCVNEAEALGVPMWVAHSVRQFLLHVVSQGGGDRSNTSLVEFFERWAGVQVKAANIRPLPKGDEPWTG